MSGKRGAGEQLTRENFREDESDEEGNSQPVRASADVLSKRKIIKPRGRLGRAGGITASSGINFGATTSQHGNASAFGELNSLKPAESTLTNAFRPFAKPAEKPANAFGGFGQSAEEKPTNAFGMFAPKKDTTPASGVFNFVNSEDARKDTSLVSNKSTEKASKIKALNENFYDKITEERKVNPVSNFTPILRKYIDYYDKIDRDVDMEDADSETPKQKVLEASPAQKTASTGLSFSHSDKQSFSFGSKQADEAPLEKEPTPMEDSLVKENSDVIDVDSDDSDDSIKLEGPTFTLAKPPTTTDSVFKFNGSSAEQKSTGTGPTFTFASTGKGDSVFKLKPETKVETPEAKAELSAMAKPAFAPSNSFSWSPGKPDEKVEERKTASKSSFSFGSTETKPASFSFSAPSTTTEEPKTFKFGGSTQQTGDKPSFSFGSATQDKTDKPTLGFGSTDKPSGFNFGSTDKPSGFSFGSTDDKPAFTFGGSNMDDKPSFSFGDNSAASTFSFGGSNANTNPQPSNGQNEKNDDDNDKVDEAEPDVHFKPVTQLKDQVTVSTGEEEETVKYTKRSKLLHFDATEKAYKSNGVGELKLLQNTATGKSRLLLRAEGSERVILNTAIGKTLEYTNVGKGVRVPVVEEGKIETYVLRVKTDDDANALLAAIGECKASL